MRCFSLVPLPPKTRTYSQFPPPSPFQKTTTPQLALGLGVSALVVAYIGRLAKTALAEADVADVEWSVDDAAGGGGGGGGPELETPGGSAAGHSPGASSD